METGRGDRLGRHFTGSMTDVENNVVKKMERVRLQIACFLHRELPIRLAHRVQNLESTGIFSNNGKAFTKTQTLFTFSLSHLRNN